MAPHQIDTAPAEDHAPSFIGVLLAIVGSSLIGLSYTASKNAHNNASLAQQQQQQSSFTEDSSQQNNAISSNRTIDDYEGFHGSCSIADANEAAMETEPLLHVERVSISDPVLYSETMEPYSITGAMSHKEWWFSMLLLLSGEICNFMAYGYAPTSVIAPLGTLSIISGALSGYLYLGEKIRPRNLGGMLLSIIGATVIVFFSREQEPQLSPEAIVEAILQPHFLIYLAVVVGIAVVLLILDVSKVKGASNTLGDQTMAIRVCLTAIFSGFTVLSTKGISSLLGLTFYHMFTYWITYVLVLVLIVNSVLTLYYTNKALSAFDSTLVLPAEFGTFTFSAVLGSALLYNDFGNATWFQTLMFAVGCLITFSGVYFITSDSDKFGKPVNQRASTILISGFPADIEAGIRPRSATSQTILRVNLDVKPALLTPPPPSSRSVPNFEHDPISNGDGGLLRLYVPSSSEGDNGLISESRQSWMDADFADFAKRLSRSGIVGIASILNALGTTRASMSFQQVVLKRDRSVRVSGRMRHQDLDPASLNISTKDECYRFRSNSQMSSLIDSDPPRRNVLVVTPLFHPNVNGDAEPEILQVPTNTKCHELVNGSKFEVVPAMDDTQQMAIVIRPIDDGGSECESSSSHPTARSQSQAPSFIIHPIPEGSSSKRKSWASLGSSPQNMRPGDPEADAIDSLPDLSATHDPSFTNTTSASFSGNLSVSSSSKSKNLRRWIAKKILRKDDST